MREKPVTARFSGLREDFSRVALLQNCYSNFCVFPSKTDLGEFIPEKPTCSKGKKG